MKKIFSKYESLIKYGFFGVITVGINLLLYKIFLEFKMHYIIASLASYIIASLVSYYFNLFFVFNQRISKFKEEIVRLFKYFSVRIGSVFIDTFLLYISVDILKGDKFISKIFISFIVILATYFFNKRILKKGDV
ncbi:MAG: GtrA family protein [Bacilli bacterium]